MLTSRRGFLLGTAGLITASFLREAVRYIDCENEPLLLEPEIEGDVLYALDTGTGGPYVAAFGQLFWTVWNWPTWTWMEFAEVRAEAFGQELDLDKFCTTYNLNPAQLDARLPDDEVWENFLRSGGPVPRAHRLLKGLDLGPEYAPGGSQAGSITFSEGGWSTHPEARLADKLSLSLLQARLIELKQPIKIVLDTWGE